MLIQLIIFIFGTISVHSLVKKVYISRINTNLSAKLIESFENRRIGKSNVVLIVDGGNVRGKSRFRLSKEELLYACSEMAKRSPFLSVLIVFDHGSQEEAFMLPIEDVKKDYGGESVLTRGIGVHFAGPEEECR